MIMIMIIMIILIIITIIIISIIIIIGSWRETNGVSTNGIAANLMLFDGGTFWVLPLTYFYLPKSARAYLFPQSVKQSLLSQRPR